MLGFLVPLAVMVALAAPAQGGDDVPRLPRVGPPRPLDLRLFQVEEHTLPNGLQVRLVADHSVPTVSYWTFFRVGSRNELPGRTGIAHLFEHMMFNGAKKYGPKEFDRVLESQGGTSNAFTSNDVTAYFDDFASDALETVIDLESDRMRSLAITPETLKSEREVVKEERRLRVDNDVGGMLEEALDSVLFRAHPYHWPVIGWMKDLDAISREDAQGFFRTYYAPTNATIVAVGDLDPQKTLALIERYYGDIPRGPAVPGVLDDEPEGTGERRIEVRYPAQAPALMVGYLATAARNPDSLVLDVIQAVIATGDSSRLTRRLVQEDQIATHVSVDFTWRFDPGAFDVMAELKPGVKPARAEAAIDEELASVAAKGVTPTELQKAKNTLRAQFLGDMATNGGRAHVLGTYDVLLGDWRAAQKTLDGYAKVTNEDIKRVARRTFRTENRAVATLVPGAAKAQE